MLTRRDFLKIAGAASLSLSLPEVSLKNHWSRSLEPKHNILIIVLDALSAYHINMFGYDRKTMPNLSNLAEKAIVYHSHYAGGNYTTPGTASILTGTLPWTHRAVVHNDVVADDFVDKNIFSVFPDYYKIAYSHNILVNTQLRQFEKYIDEYTPRTRLFLGNDSFIKELFENDDDIASVGWVRALKREEEGYSYSLFLSRIYELLKGKKIKEFGENYPRGLPSVNVDEYYILEQGVDYLIKQLSEIPHPFLGYYHFLPPHEPYHPRKEFIGSFDGDGIKIINKPFHLFSQGKDYNLLNKNSNYYDEFIRYADYEFARLFDSMERKGLLDNTYLILTSDHGELFERGILGHSTPVLHQPIIRVPLLLFEPGRTSRLDVYQPTSCIDLLPTLLYLDEKEIPDWVEGSVLPPFVDQNEVAERDLFVVQVKGDIKDKPITKGTIMLLRGAMKLMYYFGYNELGQNDHFLELYDLENDPNELNNLYPSNKSAGNELLAVIQHNLVYVNSPYMNN
jgi:hypothetical protein